MYEDITYEVILQRMLDRIPNTMDKREGSVIYDALAPAAAELQIAYIELDNILNETFADTASRAALIRRAAERGITPYPASQAVIQAVSVPSTAEIPTGTRFSLGDKNYFVSEKVSAGVYNLTCETAGSEGNDISGSMIPIDYVDGLESITAAELLIPGEDEEDTEVFRERYFSSTEIKAYGGNRADYIEKTNSISGVGSTKVTRAWNGGGTVLLTILNSEFSKASDALIARVQEIIDPDSEGDGTGVAPIDHQVTVDTVTEVPINITSNITFQEGYSFDSQKQLIKDAINEYLLELRKEWADNETLTVRISKIDNKILGVQGVIDITGTELNGEAANAQLTTYQVPVLGTVSG